MLCATGVQLSREYRQATKDRADARDALLLSSALKEPCEDSLFLAKRKYNQAFVAWVSHRALCLHCRERNAGDERLQFGSV